MTYFDLDALCVNPDPTVFNDADGAHLEHEGLAVADLTWHEGGIMVRFHRDPADHEDGYSFSDANVPEDAWFTAGTAMVRGYELNLIYGQEVDAKTARFGK